MHPPATQHPRFLHRMYRALREWQLLCHILGHHRAEANPSSHECMESPVTPRIAFPIMRWTVSPMPIGWTPGFLSRGIRRHATKASRAAGLMYDVAKRRAEQARALQRSSDASPNAVHIRLHPSASMPDVPAAPPV